MYDSASAEMWMGVETVKQSEVSQENKYRILMQICGIRKILVYTILFTKQK